ncbi:hypothetical protein DNTS_016120 [Danionella cerebrum]|uniref:Rho-GAP domain-containing protein n=1 Tax=Danionella cerebrum TaxID=2873325 RepID=A0A553Q8N6_9TELE|nr:hypothetical protein DNTS_016120 [Danionella translucida]
MDSVTHKSSSNKKLSSVEKIHSSHLRDKLTVSPSKYDRVIRLEPVPLEEELSRSDAATDRNPGVHSSSEAGDLSLSSSITGWKLSSGNAVSKTAEARSLARSISPLPCVLMKVLSGNSTNKTLMDSDLPLDGNSKNSALLKQFHNQEAQAQHSVDNGGRKTFFPFKLKRSSTSPSVPVRAESAGKNLLFGRNLQDEPVLPKPIAAPPHLHDHLSICSNTQNLAFRHIRPSLAPLPPRSNPGNEFVVVLLWDCLEPLITSSGTILKGPSTEGVFRVSCNNKNLNALRDQLNSGAVVDMEALPVTLLIFLKELPGGLLVFELFESWMKALEKETAEDIRSELRRMVEKLPKANSLLLQHLLCLFHHISQRSETNKMDAKNLAVCIAPTLLHRDSQTLDVDEVEKVTKLIQFLTENCYTASSMSPDISFEVQQQDSAYDSTDPEVDLECVAGESQVQEDRFTSRRNQGLNRIGCSGIQSCSSDAIFDAFTKSCNRRRSEPSILSSASMMGLRELARSHDDFSLAKTHFDEQLLKKQNSDDSFLQPNHSENSRAQITFKKLVGSLNMDLPIGASSAATKASSCPSFCSTESTSSNHSEKSVPQSPTPSPANPRKSQSTRHSSFLIKIRHNHSQGDLEVNHRSLSARAKSLGNFTPSRGSLRKGESQKEVTFPCETLQEDLQNETEKVDELVRRRRPLSAIEVFQQVDSRTPCNPPSYEQALQNGAQPAPPKYRAMTVKHARELNRKSRPTSMNDCLLDIYNGPTGIDENFTESSGLEEPKTVSFRQRAMSESVSQARHERVSRRCSQPVFEEFSYAKESYV